MSAKSQTLNPVDAALHWIVVVSLCPTGEELHRFVYCEVSTWDLILLTLCSDLFGELPNAFKCILEPGIPGLFFPWLCDVDVSIYLFPSIVGDVVTNEVTDKLPFPLVVLGLSLTMNSYMYDRSKVRV